MKGLDPDVEDEMLDVYTPNEPGEWPIVIYAYGSEDNKNNDMSQEVGSTLAAQGFVVFVIDYEPQSPGIIWIKHGRRTRQLVETASCAIRFARAKAPDFNGSPNRVIWAGFSAGGYAGGFAAFHVPDHFALWDEFAANNDGPSQQVQCAVDGGSDQVNDLVMLSSSFYLPPEAKEKDPELWDFLNQIYPPGINTDLRVRMIHGTKDNIVPYADAQSFYNTLKGGGYDIELEAVEGGGHGVYLDQIVETILRLSRNS